MTLSGDTIKLYTLYIHTCYRLLLYYSQSIHIYLHTLYLERFTQYMNNVQSYYKLLIILHVYSLLSLMTDVNSTRKLHSQSATSSTTEYLKASYMSRVEICF